MTQEELKNSETQNTVESINPSSSEETADTSFLGTLFSFSGRNRRSRYFLTILLVCFLSLFMGVFAGAGEEAMAIIFAIFMIPIIWISIANVVKRCHDLGKSGALSLLFFVPVANFILGLYLLFAEGDMNDNEYGPSPYKDTVE